MLAAGRESALINREHRQRGPIKRRRYLPSAERKREILDAALIEFSDRGYTATTIETIATRAGLSKTGIYAHYKSKEEVFEDLLMTVLSPSEKVEVPFDADKPLDSILEAFLDSLYPMLGQPSTLAVIRLLVMESRRISPDIVHRWYHRVVESRWTQDRAFFDECVERGVIRRGVMTESDLLARSPLTYWITLYLLFGENVPVSLAQVRQEHKRMLLELREPR